MTVVLKDRLAVYLQLARLDKPIGILLLLWPTLWALWLAGDGHPGVDLVGIFTLGTVLMRSAGCVINDYADRHFDAHVARTAQRPFARGAVSEREALWLASGLAALAFLLVLPLNALTWWMSLPALFLAGSYPFTKRFLAIPQAYLGLAFGFGIPMVFAATQDAIPPLAWLMLAAGIGSLITLTRVGGWVARHGARPVVLCGAGVVSACLAAFLFAPGYAVLMVLLFAFGLGSGGNRPALSEEGEEALTDMARDRKSVV